MAKYFYNETNNEVKIGDRITIIDPYKGVISAIDVTEDNISSLVEEGLIKERDASIYIEKLAKKIGLTPSSTERFLKRIAKMDEAAAFHILLKQVAMEFDKKYSDHISKCSNFWIVSNHSKNIIQMEGHAELHMDHAVFRTAEEADKAVEIVQSFFNEDNGRE